MLKNLFIIFSLLFAFCSNAQYSVNSVISSLGGSNSVVTAGATSNYTQSITIAGTRYVALRCSFVTTNSGASGNLYSVWQSSLDRTNWNTRCTLTNVASGTSLSYAETNIDIHSDQWIKLVRITNSVSHKVTNLLAGITYKVSVAQDVASAIGYDVQPATTILTNVGNGNGTALSVSWTNLVNVPSGFADNTDNTGSGGGIEQTNISYTAVTNAPWQFGSANLTNWSGTTLFDTNGVTTAFIAADTVVSNGLSTRLINTNSALATRISDATNGLYSTLIADDVVITNGLSDRLIATNNLLVSNISNATNGLYSIGIATTNYVNSTVQLEGRQRIFRSPNLAIAATAVIASSNTAYFVYMGKTSGALTVQFVKFYVTTAGAGTQNAEVGLFSTPNAPNGTAQTLTKIVANATLSSLTTTGIKSNTVALAQSVAAGTHLWAGVRFGMVTTQPTCASVAYDMNGGNLLTTASAGLLTSSSTFSGAVPIVVATGQGPELRITLD